VNVAGYVRAENGVGECVRSLIAILDAAGVARSVIDFDRTDSRQQVRFDVEASGTHPTNIVCVNADQFRNFASEHEELLRGRYTIGLWSWEVDVLPDEMAASSLLTDEIWTVSEHAARAVRAAVDRPVFVLPNSVIPRERPLLSRRELGLPEGSVFLFCFDFDSVFERKNPLGVIEAFGRAFAPDEGPQLVIKSVRGDAHPQQLERLRAAASRRNDVHVMDGYVSADRQNALMASADAYVSLHRAEGYGLTIAEAMANGTPTIATGYTGNLEFMDETNSWLVGYELAPIGPGCDPYPADARWAEPDLDAAAAAMREIVADPAAARVRGERAASDIARLHAPATRAWFVLDRLEAIADANPPPPPPPPPPKPAMEPVRVEPSKARAEIESLLERGPDLESPSRMPGISRRFRTFVLRVLRHHDEHRLLVDRAIISAIDEIHVFEQEIRDEMWKLYRLEHRTDEVAETEVRLLHELDEARARIRDLEGQLRRQRRALRDIEGGG